MPKPQQLPVDVIPLLFQYCLRNLRDLSTVSLVCREWRSASLRECGPDALRYLPTARLPSTSTAKDYMRLALREGLQRVQVHPGTDNKNMDALVQTLGSLRSLETLNLSGCFVTDQGFSSLPRCTRLHTLKLVGCTGVSLESLPMLGRLRSLDLRFIGASVSDESVRVLSGVLQLQTLRLDSNTRLTDMSLRVFGRMNQLLELELVFLPNITDEGVACLSGLKQLHKLSLEDNPQLTDLSLQTVGRLVELGEFRVGSSFADSQWITDVGVGYLSGLSRLHTLTLNSCVRITDHSLRVVGRFNELRILRLICLRRITDKGIVDLSGLSHLVALRLNGCNLLTNIAPLASLVHLCELSLFECPNITRRDFLQRPGLHIYPIIQGQTWRITSRWVLEH
jgi:hypothetical protein